ncbi:hypothetical protein QV08_05545 [Gallibacterium salpingitidis]|uniref:Glutaredoxin n=1 Tax=Gallibacterium salpingitidis TaxID=505341 RepID=A0A1A7Q229_9PAST|nr:hypothetical protein [Gallibacterium salpingitidis]OBW95078.1 hypothetical protein QS62_04450 [Gallibacterium salpingitidis]OBX08106.1 hypothetical protein QV08_05545 [Gallibacterium salpingitidis]OBX11725.1 hypothetical protein QV09_01420 [Gallibacterium salpingitidis]
MTKPVLFFAHLCPDTEPFVKELQRLNVEYESVSILESMANLKRFLRLRDQHSAFDSVKANGYVGVPALVLADEQVILDYQQLAKIFAHN